MDTLNEIILKDFKNNIDIKEGVREYIEQIVNKYMIQELNEFLGMNSYEHHQSNNRNYRNGTYNRRLATRYGVLNLKVPRDRKGLFHSRIINSYKRRTNDFDNIIINLYRRGMSTSEVSEHVKQTYKQIYTPQTISNLTKVFDREVLLFKKKRLSHNYVFVYLDATYINVRRKNVRKETIYIAIGVTNSGYKNVIGYYISPQESSNNWEILLNDLKRRGLINPLLFISDGLNGLTQKVKSVFPNSLHQKCLIHTARKILKTVSNNDKKLVINDFTKLYKAPNYDYGKLIINSFIEKWGYKYRQIFQILNNYDGFLSWLLFPLSIRKSIYSNNLIESFNKKLKRQTKKREQFPNINSLERMLIIVISDYNSSCKKIINYEVNDIS